MGRNAVGLNGGKAAARFWITKAAEVVIYGGMAKMAGAPKPSPAAAPAEASEAAAQKAAPTAPAEAATKPAATAAVEGSGEATAKGAPKPTPKFQSPTNPPQNPPNEIPQGWRVREMPPTKQYPNGYWKLEKPMADGSWQPIDPSTMKPGGRPETHIPFPPKKGN